MTSAWENRACSTEGEAKTGATETLTCNPRPMPNPHSKVPANHQGPYYVDTDCIDCHMCRNLAPDHFGFDESTGLSYVKRQPETKDERDVVEEAKERCPVESIGDDGE